MIDINNLQTYAEDNRIEAKKSKANLPNSIWETYSSFANTDGGIILLGVEENNDHSLVVTGVDDAHKIQTDFWNMVNNRQKVNINILTNRMVSVQEIDGKNIIAIHVPKVDRKQRPVYVGLDPMKGTYRRDFEGDHLCTTDEVSSMYRDASDKSLDLKVLKGIDMSVFDMETVHRYRNRFRQFHPVHVWNDDDDEVFLRRIGAMAVCKEDIQFHPTAAGLLMFGREYDIVREFPDYFLDYQEKLSVGVRWTHRMVSTSGDWSGNLYDFFFRVYPRITADLPIPFVANGKDRIDETRLHLALREVLLNICAHTDYYGRQGIVIVKTTDEMTFTNPGDIRIGLKAALTGGVSDPRNVTIMKMFTLVDIGERAGSGIPDFIHTWQTYVDFTPSFQISHNPERTKLTIPYTQIALQKAGEILSNTDKQSTSQSTKSTSQSTHKAQQSTTESIQSTSYCALSDTAKEILEIIRKNPQITYDEIAKTTGKARSGIARHIKNLQEKGFLIAKNNNGEWKVAISSNK